MTNKKGISLIVLIVTIIVIIVLAAVVILTLSKNNPIESAKEARFKEDVRTFQDELALAVSKQYTAAGGHRDEKISTSDFNEIQDYIPSFSEKYTDKFVIENDELVYTSKVTETEKVYLSSLNIKREFNYIQDGLILHLDGINNTRNGHSDTTTVWEDLSGNNYDFNKLESALEAKWSKNSYVGDKKFRTLFLNNPILKNEDECTVEVCYDVPKFEDYDWVFCNRNVNQPPNGFQFVIGSTGRSITIFYNNSIYNYYKNIVDLNRRTMGFSIDSNTVIFTDNANFYTEITKDGIVKKITDRNIYSIGSGYPWTGASLYTFNGNIYSIRIYNRKLSEDELRNNYEVDKERFEF